MKRIDIGAGSQDWSTITEGEVRLFFFDLKGEAIEVTLGNDLFGIDRLQAR